MSVQMFLPALPVVRADLGVSTGAAQTTLSSAMVAMAIAMLLYGPLSDRFGRRPVLIAGHLLFVAGSLVCSVATGLGPIVLGRVLQAAGAVAGLVLSRTIVRDAWPEARVPAVLATIGAVMAIIPMVSPATGGLLTEHYGWRAIFVVCAGIGSLSLLLVLTAVPETHRERNPLGSVASSFGPLLRSQRFLRFGLQSAFLTAGFATITSAATYLVTPAEFGFYFVGVAGAYMAGSAVAARFSHLVGLDRMVAIGVAGSLLSIAAMAALALLGFRHPLAIFGPTSGVTFFQGIWMPNSQTGVVGAVPERAGTASGLSGFMNHACSACLVQIVGWLQNGTVWPMIALSLTAAMISATAFASLRSGAKRQGRRAVE